eukprot:CAMPEP_0180427124 /NCGR_PEP_ID=MMETSP1036_2-20121128/6153_1 /TAXON_ID=632150 /ORGANISM="Azadinium spinosum, Strain 3D9" /LENGTH=143 /DNA_ID=CAMNT_0022432707 /DNA_START=1 /DNA_END=432 /DNA_ORIENTATION=+
MAFQLHPFHGVPRLPSCFASISALGLAMAMIGVESSAVVIPSVELTRSSVLSLSVESYAALTEDQKQLVTDLLLRISKQSIPPTPRLAGMAVADLRRARGKLKELNINPSCASQDAHDNPGGGYAIVGGKTFGIRVPDDGTGL